MSDAGANLDAVRRIADAVLYEGYILYPYRASSEYAAVDPSESSVTQSEWVLEHSGQPAVQVILRFLQVQRRSTEGAAGSWDEAVEREIEFTFGPGELLGSDLAREFSVPGGEDREPSPDAGIAVRRREPLAGQVCVRTSPVPGPWRAVRLQVRVENRSAAEPAPAVRDDALPTALVAAHVIVTVTGGEFISMTDPPMWAKAAVDEWVAMIREEEALASATHSVAELEARATDPRAAALIDRVESMDAPTMERLHGTIRGLRSGASGALHPGASGAERSGASGAGGGGLADYDPVVPWWDPEADASVSPDTDSVLIGGQQVARGSLVRLRPGARRADAQDMFLVGRIAEVQAVLLDIEDQPYLAVALTDHPDPDLSIAHGRFLYFMPDEVEPCQAEGAP